MKSTKITKVLVFVLAMTLVLGSTLAFAAPYDLVHKTDPSKNHTFAEFTDSPAAFNEVINDVDDYLIEAENGDLYLVTEVDAATQDGTSFNDAIAGLDPYVEGDLEVVEVEVVNKTTIRVEFSDGIESNFTVAPLNDGANTVTFTYEGKTFTETVYWVDKPAVQSVEFDNYRQLTVTFNTVVDIPSAVDPANYYFEIVEGDAAFGAAPTLQDSNQLSEIVTDSDFSLVPGWWDPIYEHITAETVNGKTVVTINLPEDARFTNSVDTNSTGSAGTEDGAVNDEERTLHVNLADGGQKALIKNTNVVVGVRNVRNSDGIRKIDTAVESIKILDEVNPELVGKTRIHTSEAPLDFGSSVEVYDDGSHTVELEFDEPVFDAHDLNTGTQDRDVRVYVNGRLAASTADVDLAGILDFDMSEDATYDSARVATFDPAAAVTAAGGGETFMDGDVHTIRILGITDLAANIQVPTEVEFNVVVKDAPIPSTPPSTTTKPEVLGVDQVADNIFRVEWNMADATGEFIIENADGEGGLLLQNTPLSTSDGGTPQRYFSYVVVDSLDVDTAGTTDDPVAADNNILAYDGQTELNRIVRVRNLWSVDGTPEYAIQGDNYVVNGGNTMQILKDTLAPVVVDRAGVLEAWNSANVLAGQLVLDVEDLLPDTWTGEFENPVKALIYDYNNNIGGDIDRNAVVAFGDDTDITATAEYLPIKVSYVDENDATRSALLSNVALPDTAGQTGSISYNAGTQLLTLDISGYPSLVDGGDLVNGARYKIEMPAGFFADPEKEDMLITPTTPPQTSDADFMADVSWATGLAGTDTLSGVTAGDAYTAAAAPDFEVLHVAQARTEDLAPPVGKGYSSKKQIVTYPIDVEPTAPGGVDEDAVPQTSKELITYDEDTNEITVEFTGAIDVATLKTAANYTLNGKTLAAWGVSNSDITYKVETDINGDITNQYAVFEVPQDSVLQDGDVQFIVEGVTNPAGGMMTQVLTQIGLLDNTRPVATKLVKQGDYQIIMTFDEPLEYRELSNEFTAAKNFIIKINGVEFQGAVLEARLVDGERKVTLQLGIDITATPGDITVEITEDNAGNINIIDMSQNKNPLNSDKVYDVQR